MGKTDDPERFYIETLMQEKLEMYLKYVSHHSLMGDLGLIFKTIAAVILVR